MAEEEISLRTSTFYMHARVVERRESGYTCYTSQEKNFPDSIMSKPNRAWVKGCMHVYIIKRETEQGLYESYTRIRSKVEMKFLYWTVEILV